jgi:hypothetical protein
MGAAHADEGEEQGGGNKGVGEAALAAVAAVAAALSLLFLV